MAAALASHEQLEKEETIAAVNQEHSTWKVNRNRKLNVSSKLGFIFFYYL